MWQRIYCPYHKDDTPSLIVYADAYHCFGCGKHGKRSEIGIAEGAIDVTPIKEDIEARLKYIRSLPKEEIRGLQFYANELYYFILWPSGKYYKRRSKAGGAEPKYKCPAGHVKPLFVAKETGSDWLVICEGEINALSIAEADVNADICSPGSANEFYSSKLKNYLTFYSKYNNILLIADKDAAGAIGVIELKARLLNENKRVKVLLIEPDANEILVKHGKETLKSVIEKEIKEAT